MRKYSSPELNVVDALLDILEGSPFDPNPNETEQIPMG